MERTLAPRLAFLASVGLPHGYALIAPIDDHYDHRDRCSNIDDEGFTLKQLLAKRSPADFTALCNQALANCDHKNSGVRSSSDSDHIDADYGSDSENNVDATKFALVSSSSPSSSLRVTVADVKAFEDAFGRGLLAASRCEGNFWPLSSEASDTSEAAAVASDPKSIGINSDSNTHDNDEETIDLDKEKLSDASQALPPPITRLRVSPHEMVALLMAHGADATERDRRGVSLVHHACGAGQWQCAEALAKVMVMVVTIAVGT